MMFNAVVCMHCGPTGAAHVFWLLLVALGLFAAAIVSAVARRRAAAGA